MNFSNGERLRRKLLGDSLPAVSCRSDTLGNGLLWMFAWTPYCTFPLVARFEEVWVVDDGAGLQICGTYELRMQGDGNGMRRSI